MKTKILAVALLMLLAPSAWAQQETPVYAANGVTRTIQSNVLGGLAGATHTETFYGDFSRYSELEIRYYSTLNLAAFIPLACNASASYIGVVQGNQTTWTAATSLGAANAYVPVVSMGSPATQRRYRVAPATGPLTIVVKSAAIAGRSCAIHVEVRGVVFPSSGVAVGEVLDGTTVTPTDIRPVIVGGINADTSLLKTLNVDDTGALKISGGGTTPLISGDAPPGGYTVTGIGGLDSVGNKIYTVSVDATGALKTAGGSSAVAFAPGVPTKVALSASTSACACGLTPTSDYELSCTVDAAFRHGAATPTAVLDDVQLRAGAVRSPLRLPTGSTCFCFISTSSGACYVSRIPTS
jgi:hypothetical protein